MTAPRIPRDRPPVIPLHSRPAWYENTLNRVLCIVLLAVFGSVAVHALIVWWSASQ